MRIATSIPLSPLLSAILLLAVFAAPTQAATCYDILNPLTPRVMQATECTTAERLIRRQSAIDRANSTDMFMVFFTCGVSDQKRCDKVKHAFDVAGNIITTALKLNQPINVNATFTDFCDTFGDCGSPQGFLTLGGAAPARTIPMTDDDNIIRLYPQALVKQFQSGKQDFTQYDITAMFNAVANFWFEGDGPIKPEQSDFLFVIVHELMHGLGFTSSWDDYINETPQALTPGVATTITGNQQSYSFVEFALDRYIVVMPEGTRLTKMAQQIESFSTGDGSSLGTPQQFAKSFLQSSQYSVAENVYALATKAKSLAFLPAGTTDMSKAVTIETSLNPFQSGSSMSHVDYSTFTDTPDFLMRYLQDRGVSLSDAILKGGNYSGGPIGPGLKNILQSLGYATTDNPTPYTPRPSSDSASGAATTSPSNLIFASSLTLALWFVGRLQDAIRS